MDSSDKPEVAVWYSRRPNFPVARAASSPWVRAACRQTSDSASSSPAEKRMTGARRMSGPLPSEVADIEAASGAGVLALQIPFRPFPQDTQGTEYLLLYQ